MIQFKCFQSTHLGSAVHKHLSLALIFLLLSFLFISFNQSAASTYSTGLLSSTATIKLPAVNLNEGTAGASLVTSTHDYASVSVTAGYTFYQNTSALIDNTDFTIPSQSGSFVIPEGISINLYSPIFPSATTIYSGSWILDLWASANLPGALSVSFAVIDASNNIIVLAASGSSATIGTLKSQSTTDFFGSQIIVPTGGRLIAVLTNIAGSGKTFTLYWGSGQATNYKTPSDYDYALTISNTASVPYYISLAAYSSSGLGRLTSMDIIVYSPNTNQIVIANGELTQSSGSTVTIQSNSILYLGISAMANNFGTTNLIFQMRISPSTRPYVYDVINLAVN
jgi:hypothetical protein